MKEENLVFLISQPRSGSTLTQKILGANEKVYTRSEPWVMLRPAYSLKNEGMYAEYDCVLEKIALDSFIADQPNGRQTYIDELKNMYLKLYSNYIDDSEAEYFLDKTPRYYLILDELVKIYPNAKYILLIRNPLAVLGSIINSWTKENWFNLASNKYDLTTALEVNLDVLNGKYGNVHVMRYEKIISDCKSEIRRAFEYLGLTFDEGALNYSNESDEKWIFGDQETVYNNAGIVSGNDCKWHDGLDDPQYWRVMYDYLNYIGEDVYQRLGYDYNQDLCVLNDLMPGDKLEDVISKTFSLFSLLDNARDCLIENQRNKAVIEENAKVIQGKLHDIALLNDLINKKQRKIEKYKLEASARTAETSRLKTEFAQLKTESTKIKTETAQIKTESTQIKTENAQLKTESTKIKTETAQLKTESTQIKTETAQLKTENAQIKTESAQLKTENAQLITDLTQLKAEYLRLKQDLSEKENELLIQNQKQLEYKTALDNLNKRYNELSSEKESILNNLRFQKIEIVQKNKIIDNLQKQISNHVNHTNMLIHDKHAEIDQLVNTITFKVGKAVVAPGHYSKRYYKWLLGKKNIVAVPHVERRIEMDFGDQITQYFGNHRSGWSFTVSCLAPLHTGSGIYFDTFIERTFVWKPGDIEPTQRPWIGFIHVPPNVPEWFQSQQSNKAIFETEQWKQSLPYCKGLFTLSDYHRKVLETKLNVPVSSLLHPTDLNVKQWTPEAFDRNNLKRIVAIRSRQ